MKNEYERGYDVMCVVGGYVVTFCRDWRTEYMGRDNYWTRDAVYAMPFASHESADAVIPRRRRGSD